MKRIFIVVEGETEGRFIRDVLYEPFILNGTHIEGQQWTTNRKKALMEAVQVLIWLKVT